MNVMRDEGKCRDAGGSSPFARHAERRRSISVLIGALQPESWPQRSAEGAKKHEELSLDFCASCAFLRLGVSASALGLGFQRCFAFAQHDGSGKKRIRMTPTKKPHLSYDTI